MQNRIDGVPGKTEDRPTSVSVVVWAIASSVLLLHLLTANRYGYFGDEMYFMACGQHLAWGYVDQPPLIALLAWLARHLFGTSLLAVRLFPALAGFALVLLTGRITLELEGRRFSQGLAALCTACAAVYLASQRLLTMNAFEPLFWMGCALVVIRMIKTGNQKLWVGFGLIAGLGLQNKYSMAVFLFAVFVGLTVTPARKAFAGKWIWIGGLMAFFIFLPNVIWNFQHHWPFLEFQRNVHASGNNLPFSPLGYMAAQIALFSGVIFPVAVVGVLYFLFGRDARPFRLLGWAFVIVLLIFIILQGKDYYAAPVYPMALAGGAKAIEAFLARRRLGWPKPAMVALILAVTGSFLPLVVPVLSPEAFLRYQSKLPFKMQPDEKSMIQESVPHYFAFCFGWEELVGGVAKVYQSLSPEERADTAIFANDFASAGAIDLIGPKYGLPKALSGHQNYWLWGPHGYSGRTMILAATTMESARRWFDEVTAVVELHDPFAAPWEQRPILLCRGLKQFRSLTDAWPSLKNWD